MDYLHEFAHLLRIYLERNGRSPDWLAQQLRLNPETVNAWLNGQERPRDREIVTKMIDLLSIDHPEERDDFLRATGNPSAQSTITNQTNFYGPVRGPIHTGSGSIYINTFSLTPLKEWLNDFFHWSEADKHAQSSWEGMVLWSLSAISDRLTPQGWLILLEIVVVWIATGWLVVPFLQWPLADPITRLTVGIKYAFASVVAPLLIALTTTPVQQSDFEIQAKQDQWKILFLKATGALVGFAVFSAILLILAVVFHYLSFTLPAWLWYGLVLIPLFFSYITARRIPIDRYKMFGPRPQLHDGDKLFFIVFLLFGPLLVGFVYWWYDYLAMPIMGFTVLLIFIGIALWEQRKRAPTFLSEAATILLVGLILPTLGILLFVFLSGQFDSDTLSRLDFFPQLILAMLYVSGLTTLGVTLFLRNRPNLTLQGVLGLLAVVLLLNGVLALDLTAGRWLTLAIMILWVLWGRRRFRHLLWVHTTFPLMLTAIGVSFYLAVVMVIPIWANILGFGFTVAVLVLWAYQSPRLES